MNNVTMSCRLLEVLRMKVLFKSIFRTIDEITHQNTYITVYDMIELFAIVSVTHNYNYCYNNNKQKIKIINKIQQKFMSFFQLEYDKFLSPIVILQLSKF